MSAPFAELGELPESPRLIRRRHWLERKKQARRKVIMSYEKIVAVYDTEANANAAPEEPAIGRLSHRRHQHHP